MGRFEGRVAVVAGAGNPIGRACAVRLADEGALVVLVDAPDDPVAETAMAIGDGLSCESIVADPADASAVAAASARCAASHTAVDVLVNCQQQVDWLTVEGSDPAIWLDAIRVNLLGPLICSQAFLPLLRAGRSPAIVHLGSVDGTLGNPHVPAYSAAKGGLVPLTHVMAHEFAAHGIRVNCVARAAVTDFPPLTAAQLEPALAVTPLRRAAEPTEIAAAVAFLASDEASYVTGSVLVVDGGRSGLTPGTTR